MGFYGVGCFTRKAGRGFDSGRIMKKEQYHSILQIYSIWFTHNRKKITFQQNKDLNTLLNDVKITLRQKKNQQYFGNYNLSDTITFAKYRCT